jgi:maltooligosyltrehalose trehalohydrolase
LGIAVILDVVYNHVGQEGNYLKSFSPAYFTDRYDNEWGEAINFDGPNSGPTRDFFVANAGYWIDEYHLDGLRLDATQQIFDRAEDHILAAVVRRVRSAGRSRTTFIVGENEPQEARLVRPADCGGYGLDALWNDDFHHSAIVALTGRHEAYYSDYSGRPREFLAAAKHGFGIATETGSGASGVSGRMTPWLRSATAAIASRPRSSSTRFGCISASP